MTKVAYKTTAPLKDIDKKKLQNELKARGVSQQAASRACGYGQGYLANMGMRGSISEETVEELKRLYNIDYEDIEPDTQKQPQKCDVEEQTNEDAIYRATYSAIMNTWSFIREDLKTIIKEALSE